MHDSRFEFHHLPASNDLYNPDGTPLGEFERLPAELEAFDLICLFSVFTHLAPDDYVATCSGCSDATSGPTAASSSRAS